MRFDDLTDLGVCFGFGVTAAGGAMDTVDGGGGGGVQGTSASRLDDSDVRRPFLFDDDGVDVNDKRRAFDGGGV